MMKRFLLVASGLLVVLSGPHSRVRAEADDPHGAGSSTALVAATVSVEAPTMSATASDQGNQEQ